MNKRYPKPHPVPNGQAVDIGETLARREVQEAMQEAIGEKMAQLERSGGPVRPCQVVVTSPKAPGVQAGIQWLGEHLADRIATAFIQGAASNGVAGSTDDDLRVLAEDAAKVGRFYVEARARMAKADDEPAPSAIEVVGS